MLSVYNFNFSSNTLQASGCFFRLAISFYFCHWKSNLKESILLNENGYWGNPWCLNFRFWCLGKSGEHCMAAFLTQSRNSCCLVFYIILSLNMVYLQQKKLIIISQIGMKNYLNLRRTICDWVTKIITKGRNKTLRLREQVVEGNV